MALEETGDGGHGVFRRGHHAVHVVLDEQKRHAQQAGVHLVLLSRARLPKRIREHAELLRDQLPHVAVVVLRELLDEVQRERLLANAHCTPAHIAQASHVEVTLHRDGTRAAVLRAELELRQPVRGVLIRRRLRLVHVLLVHVWIERHRVAHHPCSRARRAHFPPRACSIGADPRTRPRRVCGKQSKGCLPFHARKKPTQAGRGKPGLSVVSDSRSHGLSSVPFLAFADESRACPTKGNQDCVAGGIPSSARDDARVSDARFCTRGRQRRSTVWFGSHPRLFTRAAPDAEARSIEASRNHTRAAESLLTGSLTSCDRDGGRKGTSHTPRDRPCDMHAVDLMTARRFSRLARVERVLPARAPPAKRQGIAP